MINEAELKILEMIHAGEITAEEGFRLIDAMGLGAEEEVSLAYAQLVEADDAPNQEKHKTVHGQIPKDDLSRIKHMKPSRLYFSFPLFVPLINWFLKNFASYIPGLQDQPHKEWIDILKNLSKEDPFYVQANDGGNQVEVFIG